MEHLDVIDHVGLIDWSLSVDQVSLMLEESFAAAGRLTTVGFPVGVQLASRLVPDVTYFLQAYVDNVRNTDGRTYHLYLSRMP